MHSGNYDAGKIMGPIWDQFSPVKVRKDHHEFLFKILKTFPPNIKIFDSCLGSGLDAIPLAKRGYTIIGNEFDENYRKTAKNKINEEKVKIELINYNWLNLNQYHTKTLFDVVLCVGNSICYIFGKEAQQKVIRNFHRLLKKDGILIIDERNFQFMLDRQKEILGDKEKFVSTHSGLNKHFLYGGEKYYPYPVKIEENLVIMGLWETGKTKPLSHFYFYAFKRNELRKLLDEVFGSENVKQYSDYQEKFNQEAGFYQYVCKKS